jgi:hypothetical protein
MITQIYECYLKFRNRKFFFDNLQLPEVLKVLARTCGISAQTQAAMLDETGSVEGREFILRKI